MKNFVDTVTVTINSGASTQSPHRTATTAAVNQHQQMCVEDVTGLSDECFEDVTGLSDDDVSVVAAATTASMSSSTRTRRTLKRKLIIDEQTATQSYQDFASFYQV